MFSGKSLLVNRAATDNSRTAMPSALRAPGRTAIRHSYAVEAQAEHSTSSQLVLLLWLSSCDSALV